MSSVLGGAQSMFTAAWDEPFALPSEASTTLALRTQQILAYETGVARSVDPLGGSYYVEALTDAMEERIVEVMTTIEEHGGMVNAVQDGFVQSLIAENAYTMQRQTESGERRVVGLNCFETEGPPPEVEGYELDPDGVRRQLERLAETKRTRDDREVAASLQRLAEAAKVDDVNLMPLLIECATAYCTVGEMVRVLTAEWGRFQQPTVF
jgi:methylmalonyl-CoA mutase, N-terminal domain